MSRAIKAVSNSQASELYQADYEPCTVSDEQKKHIRQDSDQTTAISEVERVSGNGTADQQASDQRDTSTTEREKILHRRRKRDVDRASDRHSA